MKRVLLLAVAAGSVAAASAPLSGTWSGDRFSLTATARGTLVQSDCASGKIEGTIVPGSDGRFAARGYYNEGRSGMALADLQAIDRPATFAGTVRGDRIDLIVEPKGQSPRRFALVRDRRIKFVRCL